MTHISHRIRLRKILTSLAIYVGLVLPNSGHAALLNLAQVPLANATTTTVLPNILFTLDDSGSMAWDYMPDWVGNSYPRSSNANLYRNSAFNVVYYNAAVTYTPPVLFNADGSLNTTTYPSITGGWDKVKYDAFGVRSYNSNLSGAPNQLCPDGSTPTGGAPSGACNLTNGNASYFTFVPGEYCTLPNLKVCIAASAPSTTYPYAAPVRWCNNAALLQNGGTNACQAIRISPYTFKRHPGAQGASATLTVSGGGSNTTVSSVKVNGLEILSAITSVDSTNSGVATKIRDNINACTIATTGNCTTAGYTATVSSGVVTVTAPGGITYTPVVIVASGAKIVTPTAFSGGLPGQTVYTEINSAISTTYPYPGLTVAHPNRTDCGLSRACTFDEEMTNFANWFTYYHVRHDMIKSGVSRAFKGIDNKFRVGFNLINYNGATDGANFLHIDKFELAHKNSWYTKLFAADLNGSTPLQNALGKMGKLFAKKIANQADPMQYSCQQNFGILSTDGYWNGSSNNYSLSNGLVGNLDGGATARPMKEGATATSDSLADIAKYYYETDLRTGAVGSPACTGSLGLDVCENNVFTTATDNNLQQHMTLFTIGLGADGTLTYQDDYTSASSGDFYDLKNNLNGVNWSDPIANTEGERIDDLWHAAVNGRGEYFSAKNPDQIVKGLVKALRAISAKTGAGAAAATSTLNPIAGDNLAYVASYTTVSWRGNLEARLINLDTGATSEDAAYCVEDILADVCSTPGVLQNDTSGGSNVWNCVTPLQSVCPGGTLDVAGNCIVEVATACTGTLKNKVTASSDTRKIFMKNAAGNGLIDFTFANLTGSQKAYFSSPTALSQWPDLTPAQQTLAAGNNLVNFLRGQTGYEMRTANTDKLFRLREATLGDAIESQPIFIGKPTFSYSDSGYQAFKDALPVRAKTVFLGSNDGMLHAFDAETLVERWAYVPSMVMPNMWLLADKNYSSLHRYFVNGSAVHSDIYVGGVWRTILVGSLHGGGKGYYALDVTDPANPTFLWEFTNTQVPTADHVLKMDDDLGFSFSEPKIGKRADGKWVVFLTSGYNNVDTVNSKGDGRGHVYELDPIAGTVLHKIDTNVGDTTTPSGLTKIEFYADASELNNTARFIYGGDLEGNVWRINMADYSILKLATLKDSSSVVQPITTRPELAEINGKRVVYVATGKYLEVSDLITTQQQTLYAIKDDDVTATLPNLRTATVSPNVMVQQTVTNVGVNRTSSSNPVDFGVKRGWYANFPDLGERANIDPRLEFGTLLVPTTVPDSSACAPGGRGWVNYVDSSTGGPSSGSAGGFVGFKTNTPVVGVNVIYLKPHTDPITNNLVGGGYKVSSVEAGDPTPRLIPGIGFGGSSGGFKQKRVIWRELIQ